MRRNLIIVLVILSIAAVFAQAQKKKPTQTPTKEPCANAGTQLDLNDCHCNQYHKADAELNKVYQQLISANKDDSRFLGKLKLAQRAWIAFRDAQLAAIYPETDDPRGKYGSIFPMCYCMAQQEMTEDRTKQLKRMLDGEEGDACGWNIH